MPCKLARILIPAAFLIFMAGSSISEGKAQDCFGVVINDTNGMIYVTYSSLWRPLDAHQSMNFKYPCGTTMRVCAYDTAGNSLGCENLDADYTWHIAPPTAP